MGRKTIGERPLSAKERQKRWRENKKRQNRDEYLEAERRRWAKRKAEGKTPTVGKMTRREHKRAKEKWRESKNKWKQLQQVTVTPPPSPDQQPFLDEVVPPVDGRKAGAQKRSRQKKAQLRQKLKKAMNDVEQKRKIINRLRVQLFRQKAGTKIVGPETPGKKAAALIMSSDVSGNKIRKRLTYHEVVLDSFKKPCV
jgi:hypothetical protein